MKDFYELSHATRRVTEEKETLDQVAKDYGFWKWDPKNLLVEVRIHNEFLKDCVEEQNKECKEKKSEDLSLG